MQEAGYPAYRTSCPNAGGTRPTATDGLVPLEPWMAGRGLCSVPLCKHLFHQVWRATLSKRFPFVSASSKLILPQAFLLGIRAGMPRRHPSFRARGAITGEKPLREPLPNLALTPLSSSRAGNRTFPAGLASRMTHRPGTLPTPNQGVKALVWPTTARLNKVTRHSLPSRTRNGPLLREPQ